MLSVCLGRKSYTWINPASSQPVYPNLYILLVGPPASGKSIATDNGLSLLKQVPGLRLGPDRVTSSRAITLLAEQTKKQGRAEMSFFLDELRALLASEVYDIRPDLTVLYNCPRSYVAETQKRDKEELKDVYVTLLASTQPAFLGRMMNLADLAEGFASRILFIYSDEGKVHPVFREYPNRDAIEAKLMAKLMSVASLEGEFTWDDEAREMMIEGNERGWPPAPQDPSMIHYLPRRTLHLTKLAMIASADGGRSMVITADHLRRALGWLIEAEAVMHHALTAVGSTVSRTAQIYATDYLRMHGRVPEATLRRIIGSAGVDPQQVKYLLEDMILTKTVKAIGATEGTRVFELR